ncbi:MAG TPA: hypothetical protein VFK42_14950 [Acidimicrobiales bacterium]|jgi:hypothetical protein|nr:hypothetical protein [Acidimicrobiales bacterium]
MTATVTAQASGTAYVVLDDTARVVAMFWGADAPDEAVDWSERGYRVESVDASLVA